MAPDSGPPADPIALSSHEPPAALIDPVSAGKAEIRLHLLRASGPCVASFVIGHGIRSVTGQSDESRRSVTPRDSCTEHERRPSLIVPIV